MTSSRTKLRTHSLMAFTHASTSRATPTCLRSTRHLLTSWLSFSTSLTRRFFRPVRPHPWGFAFREPACPAGSAIRPGDRSWISAARRLGSVNNQTGKWEPRRPDPHALETTWEPHERGSILVAAVFHAFLAVVSAAKCRFVQDCHAGHRYASTGRHPPRPYKKDLLLRLRAVRTASCRCASRYRLLPTRGYYVRRLPSWPGDS